MKHLYYLHIIINDGTATKISDSVEAEQFLKSNGLIENISTSSLARDCKAQVGNVTVIPLIDPLHIHLSQRVLMLEILSTALVKT